MFFGALLQGEMEPDSFVLYFFRLAEMNGKSRNFLSP